MPKSYVVFLDKTVTDCKKSVIKHFDHWLTAADYLEAIGGVIRSIKNNECISHLVFFAHGDTPPHGDTRGLFFGDFNKAALIGKQLGFHLCKEAQIIFIACYIAQKPDLIKVFSMHANAPVLINTGLIKSNFLSLYLTSNGTWEFPDEDANGFSTYSGDDFIWSNGNWITVHPDGNIIPAKRGGNYRKYDNETAYTIQELFNIIAE